ncbi:unnamed protein product [Meloidogyne enterolobii]|uniref:Uncharacterized protein n=1 Tax=Meloidogyne enterolobii TaxID=390850 RepID=A0ACB1A011_MELEN
MPIMARTACKLWLPSNKLSGQLYSSMSTINADTTSYTTAAATTTTNSSSAATASSIIYNF